MDKHTHTLLLAFGECNRMLRDHGRRLTSISSVHDVTPSTDMEVVDDAFRLMEFVDAELATGQAISWRLEVTVTADRVFVEADVRCIFSNHYELIEEIADCNYCNITDASQAIVEIAQRLCAVNPMQ